MYVVEQRYYDSGRVALKIRKMDKVDIPKDESRERYDLSYDAFDTLDEAIEFTQQPY